LSYQLAPWQLCWTWAREGLTAKSQFGKEFLWSEPIKIRDPIIVHEIRLTVQKWGGFKMVVTYGAVPKCGGNFA
jgi:hypothetical protein